MGIAEFIIGAQSRGPLAPLILRVSIARLSEYGEACLRS
jgi:hypothetical protein